MIVPVVEEVPIIVNRLMLREEIHIKRRHGEKTLQVPVQLLKQRAEITREGRTTQGDLNMADSTYTSGARTLTAFFDSQADAEEAVARLRALGLGDTEVRMTGGEDYQNRSYSDNDRGFWESISDFFFPPEDQATYAEGLRRGGYLVTVSSIPESQYDQVLDILDDEGSVDIDERAESWRSEGWSGASGVTGGVADASDIGSLSESTREACSGATSSMASDASRTSELGDDEVIPVVQEQLRVGKRDVNLGRVRVRSYVVEQPVKEDVTLREERVEIERSLSASDGDVPAILDRAADMLSGLTHGASLVLTPKTEAPIRHIEFVSLGPDRALVVLVTADGQVEADGGAFAGRAFHPHGAAVHLDQRLGQGQAQAGALGGLGMLALDLFERAGQTHQVFGRDADAGVRAGGADPLLPVLADGGA